jgi:hypothetical protein
MEDITLPELARRVDTLERRQHNLTTEFVLQAVYTRDINEIRNDIGEIKDSQKWAMRLIAGQFVVLIVSLLIFLINRLPI